jgi:CRISPR-associated endonuclease/helicase Cas3
MTTGTLPSPTPAVEEPLPLFVDLNFPVLGHALPADHNYRLYAALTSKVPGLHAEPDISILTTPGIKNHQGKISLTKESSIRIRLPITKVQLVYTMGGKRLKVGQDVVQLGIPTIEPLRSLEALKARIVVIKGFMEPDSFLAAAWLQLQALGIAAELTIPNNREGQPARKTIKIKEKTIVGFSLIASGLSPEDSIKLQIKNLGGRKKMGCGIFVPTQLSQVPSA